MDISPPMSIANARYHSLPLVTRVDFCFALVQQVTNARVRSHRHEAKAEPHRTGSVGTPAVQSTPDGDSDEFNFDFQKY